MQNFALEEIYMVYAGGHWTRRFAALKNLPDEKKLNIRAIVGHFYFGYHEVLPQPAKYVTILREPISRVISNYNWTLSNVRHAYHERVSGMSFRDYLTSEIDINDNGMTRALAGRIGRETPFGQCHESMLEQAIENLDTHFATVGLLERFDESILVFGARLKLRRFWYVKRNVTREKTLPLADLDEKTKELVKELNKLDIQLYQYASAKLQRHIDDYGPSFAHRVAMFRVANFAYGKIYRLGRALNKLVH